MENGYREVDELLPGYLSGNLSDEDRAVIDEWRMESPENEIFFQENQKAWEAWPLLNEMEQFNSFDALKKINLRISAPKTIKWWIYAQRIAATLLLPLMLYAGYVFQQNLTLKQQQKDHIVMQTITSRQGMVTRFDLVDGSKVWLNSGSSLEFPSLFAGDFREVKLKGEAFFQVAKNKNQPFQVHANGLNVEVLGTSFNVASYENEKESEVVLVEGVVKLSSGDNGVKKAFGTLHPGQRAVFAEDDHTVKAEEVTVDKYIAWRDGNLIFRNDKMEDVVKRLSRWFNVEIIISDPEIKDYAYKASIRNENLTQVLNLLRISAPIDYQITGNELLPNGEYSKQKVYLRKKKI